MKQINAFRYEAAPGELITLKFTPIGVGPLVVFAVDKIAPPDIGPSHTPTFQFTITKPVGQTHNGLITCTFPPGTPNPASVKFTSKISGSFGGGEVDGPVIKMNDPDPTAEIRWKVLAAAPDALAAVAPSKKSAKKSAKKSSGKSKPKTASKTKSKQGSKKKI